MFVHPDAALRAIVCSELRQAMNWQVLECGSESIAVAEHARDSILITVPSKYVELRALASGALDVIALQMQPVDLEVAKYLPVRPEVLTVIASGWKGFLDIARTVLTAAGVDAEALLYCDTTAERGSGR